MIDEILAHKGVLMKVNDGVAEFYKNTKMHEHGYTNFEEGPSVENLLKMRMEEVALSGESPLVAGNSETHSERVESRTRREADDEITPDGVMKEEAERQ